MIRLTDKRLLIQFLYPRWRPSKGPLQPGYSILLPLPSDLPVFYNIAMTVLGRQHLKRANEIVVLPDIPSRGFRDHVLGDRTGRVKIPVVMAEQGWLRGLAARIINRPNNYHFTQIVLGIETAGSSHVLLHDADMFILNPDLLEEHYETMIQRKVVGLGISPPWDPWFAQNGYNHLTATWEMLMRKDWIQSFPPALLHGQTNRLGDKTHTFDNTYYVQCLTDPHRIAHRPCDTDFIHFNGFICHYRWYLKNRTSYLDESFYIMFLRLLIDEFDPGGSYAHVPEWDQIARQRTSGAGRVSYPSPQTHRDAYAKIRTRIGNLFGSPLVKESSRQTFRPKMKEFDERYRYAPSTDGGNAR